MPVFKIHKSRYDEVKEKGLLYCPYCLSFIDKRKAFHHAHSLHEIDDSIRGNVIEVYDDEGDTIDMKLPPEE